MPIIFYIKIMNLHKNRPAFLHFLQNHNDQNVMKPAFFA